MIVVYSDSISPRLQYVCSFIFEELMGVQYRILCNGDEYKTADGFKINYSNNPVVADECHLPVQGLLFEAGIRPQVIDCTEYNSCKIFFNQAGRDYPFDIFSALFYLISRYEEYLPHTKDFYGRYAHENALGFKEKFLQVPIVNIWIKDFATVLVKKFHLLQLTFPSFKFIPTYDIDMAWSYRHKGCSRNMGGFIQSPSLERIAVLSGKRKDPFDAYDWMDGVHGQYNLQPIYFFLLAQKNALYDKNILPDKKAMQQLIQTHAAKYTTGIHPSWQSGDDFVVLQQEKNLLQQITQRPVINSRQHYIRFNLPEGYQRLIEAGITHDYSMGYGSINGFRASLASSYYWYNLKTEQQTNLRIHPFCYMEANSFYEQRFTAAQAFDEMMHYYKQCKKVNGTFISIWHNHFLGTEKKFDGWKELYKNFIAQVRQ